LFLDAYGAYTQKLALRSPKTPSVAITPKRSPCFGNQEHLDLSAFMACLSKRLESQSPVCRKCRFLPGTEIALFSLEKQFSEFMHFEAEVE
jgi:hypothetical protein